MAKVAIVGAGSLVFCKTLMNDFLATPALAGSEYSLMALTNTRLDKMPKVEGSGAGSLYLAPETGKVFGTAAMFGMSINVALPEE